MCKKIRHLASQRDACLREARRARRFGEERFAEFGDSELTCFGVFWWKNKEISTFFGGNIQQQKQRDSTSLGEKQNCFFLILVLLLNIQFPLEIPTFLG